MSGLATDLFAETFTPLAQIGAQSINGATVLSAACNMKSVHRLIAIINVGVMTATGIMDAKFTQAITSAGTYKDITGKAITQLLAAADSNPGKPIVLELRADELDLVNGYKFVKLNLVGQTAAVLISANIFAAYDYLPADPTLYKQAVV